MCCWCMCTCVCVCLIQFNTPNQTWLKISSPYAWVRVVSKAAKKCVAIIGRAVHSNWWWCWWAHSACLTLPPPILEVERGLLLRGSHYQYQGKFDKGYILDLIQMMIRSVGIAKKVKGRTYTKEEHAHKRCSSLHLADV